jgi:hypothetical protein
LEFSPIRLSYHYGDIVFGGDAWFL